jgi:hypothetical protein
MSKVGQHPNVCAPIDQMALFQPAWPFADSFFTAAARHHADAVCARGENGMVQNSPKSANKVGGCPTAFGGTSSPIAASH